MSRAHLLQFLQLVKQELDAHDARLEIGGAHPDAGSHVWCDLAGGWRVVAVVDQQATEREVKEQRLRDLVGAFTLTLDATTHQAPEPRRRNVREMLGEVLALVVERSEASSAVVIDTNSPVVWATSERGDDAEPDVTMAMRAAEVMQNAAVQGVDLVELLDLAPVEASRRLAQLDLGPREADEISNDLEELRADLRLPDPAAWRRILLAAKAIALVRRRDADDQAPEEHLRLVVQEPRFGCFARSFASIYRLLVAFPGPFSELAAEGAVLRALPAVESLVVSLPSFDRPPTGGGQVLRMPARPRRV